MTTLGPPRAHGGPGDGAPAGVAQGVGGPRQEVAGLLPAPPVSWRFNPRPADLALSGRAR